MDSARFDGLVRRFGQTRSRRQTLRGLAGAVVAGALALGEQAVGAQDCKRNGKACKTNSQCCSNNCVGGTGTGSTSKSDGTCQPVVTCLALGTPCSATTECCQTSGVTTVCEFELACDTQPQGLICCRPENEACSNHCECCGDASCNFALGVCIR